MYYDRRKFVSIDNTANGGVSSNTFFEYKQEGNILSATYSGGEIVKGTMIGIVMKNGCLESNYNHVNKNRSYGGRGGDVILHPKFDLMAELDYRKGEVV